MNILCNPLVVTPIVGDKATTYTNIPKRISPLQRLLSNTFLIDPGEIRYGAPMALPRKLDSYRFNSNKIVKKTIIFCLHRHTSKSFSYQ